MLQLRGHPAGVLQLLRPELRDHLAHRLGAGRLHHLAGQEALDHLDLLTLARGELELAALLVPADALGALAGGVA
jgi:hypothetical protein